jgi:hypothetical protein
VRRLLTKIAVYGPELDRLVERGTEASSRLARLTTRQLSCALKSIVDRVEVHAEFVRMFLPIETLRSFLQWDGLGLFAGDGLDAVRPKTIHLVDVPAAMLRERRRNWLPIPIRRAVSSQPNRRLLQLIKDANVAQRLVFEHRDVAIEDLAYSLGRRPASFARLVRLNYLAPDIVAAIIDGEQPADLTRQKLAQIDLPIDWPLQRRLLGFSEVLKYG